MDPFEGTGAEQRLEFDDPEHHSGHESPESGSTAKLLVMFFGAAVVCAIFFGVGYKMGRSSSSDTNTTLVQEPKPVTASAPKPSAMEQPPQVEEAGPAPAQAQPAAAAKPIASSKPPNPTPVAATHPVGNFAVQVAAVTREEDADALVNALRSKNYPVFVVGNQPGDKFFHVQVGPFPTLADAEAMRARLAADGYNPILKK